MTIRTLSAAEQRCVDFILTEGHATGWEYAAYFNATDRRLMELVTRRSKIGADPSAQLVENAKKGMSLIVHHNHPSQGSLSSTDWSGALSLNFQEIFAYSTDGTIYWGKPNDQEKVHQCQDLDLRADQVLSKCLQDANEWHALGEIPHRFAREVANRAMKNRGYVDYCVQWGTGSERVPPDPFFSSGCTPVNVVGRRYDRLFDLAADVLAKEI